MRGHYHNEQYVHCDARCDVRSLRSDIEIRCVPFQSESEARDAARRGTVFFFLFSLQARVTQPQSLSLSLSLCAFRPLHSGALTRLCTSD